MLAASLRSELLAPNGEAEAVRATATLLLRVGIGFLATAGVFFAFASGFLHATENCTRMMGSRCEATSDCCSDDLACVFYTREFAKCESLR